MRINTLGEIIKYYRKQYNINQRTICEGICSPSTLSKVENGNRLVDSLMAECLLGRIGKSVLQFELILNEEDYKQLRLRDRIEELEIEKKWEEAINVIYQYKMQMPKEESVHMQYVLYHEAKCMFSKGEFVESAPKKLLEALQQTKPHFEKEFDEFVCYNPMEIDIIMLLIEMKCSRLEIYGIEKIFEKICGFVKNIYTDEAFLITGIDILMRIVRYEEKNKAYLNVIKYVEWTLDILSNGSGIDYFADLHFIKANAIEGIYHVSNEWDEKVYLCREECLMAFHLYNIMNESKKIDELKKFCKEKLRWQITG